MKKLTQFQVGLNLGLNQAYNPVWQFSNPDGTPIAGGSLWFFESTDHNAPKNVYLDSTGNTAWPNPIILNEAGCQPENYGIFGSGSYYVEVHLTADRSSPLFFSQDNFVFPLIPPNAPEPPYFSNIDITNFIINPQFTLYGQQYDVSGASVPDDIETLAPGGWRFFKNNTSANDSITFPLFTPGQTDVPANPVVYFQYQCNSISSTESLKYLAYRFNNYGKNIVNNDQNFGFSSGSGVSTLNGQTVTMQFNGISSTNSQVTFSVYQYFGPNGSTPVETSISTFNLVNQWSSTINGTPANITFVMPSIEGMTIDPNGGDYLELRWNFPLNTSCSIGIVNCALQNLSLLVGFQSKPINQLQAQIASYQDQAITTNSQMYLDGNYDEKVIKGVKTLIPCAGKMEDWPINTPPSDALICNGLAYYQNQYYNLAQVMIGDGTLDWGPSYDSFTTSVSTHIITATCFSFGTVSSGSAGTTSFTYTQISNGSGSSSGQATIACVAGSSISAGQYFLMNAPTTSYYFWFCLNNVTIDPGINNSLLNGLEGVKIIYTGTETSSEIANLLSIQIQVAQFRVPDLRGLFSRMPNFGATAVFPVLSQLTLNASVNLSGTTFTISGLDKNGNSISENMVGPNNNTVQSVNFYSAITSIIPNASNTNTIQAGNLTYLSGIGILQPYLSGVPLILNGIWSRDIDYATRSSLYDDSSVLDNSGSFQLDQNLNHNHNVSWTIYNSSNGSQSQLVSNLTTSLPVSYTNSTQYSGGNQSNPKNVYINTIIYF